MGSGTDDEVELVGLVGGAFEFGLVASFEFCRKNKWGDFRSDVLLDVPAGVRTPRRVEARRNSLSPPNRRTKSWKSR